MNIEQEKCWLVVAIDHDRYYFDTEIRQYNNITLKELILNKMNFSNLKELKECGKGQYIIDWCSHQELDIKYSYPELKDMPLVDFGIESYLIIDLEEFYKENFASFVWGHTKKKFGLFDYKE